MCLCNGSIANVYNAKSSDTSKLLSLDVNNEEINSVSHVLNF